MFSSNACCIVCAVYLQGSGFNPCPVDTSSVLLSRELQVGYLYLYNCSVRHLVYKLSYKDDMSFFVFMFLNTI